MVIIAGTGRCGTSVLAQFYANMGFNIGRGSWDEDARGGLEDPLTGYMLAYHYWNDFIDEGKLMYSLSKMRFDVVKDPRFLDKPTIVKYLKLHFKDKLKVIILLRDMRAVVASRRHMSRLPNVRLLTTHNEQEAESAVFDVRNLYQQYYNFVMEMITWDVDFVELVYPDFLTNYKHIYQVSKGFGLEFNIDHGKKEWDNLVDMAKVGDYTNEY